MANPDSVEVNVHLLGKQYRVRCTRSEHKKLEQVIGQIRDRARTLQDTHRLSSTESVLLMLCMNMAYEASETRQGPSAEGAHQKLIEAMCRKIDRAMADAPEQLSIL